MNNQANTASNRMTVREWKASRVRAKKWKDINPSTRYSLAIKTTREWFKSRRRAA